MNRKIVCILCEEFADIVYLKDSEQVVCKNCNTETPWDIYVKVLEEWYEKGRQKGMFRDRRCGKDRRLMDDNILIATDTRNIKDRRKN